MTLSQYRNIGGSVTERRPFHEQPWLGASLSWLVPGLGQIYTGNYIHCGVFIVLEIFLFVLLLFSLLAPKCPFIASVTIAVCFSYLVPAIAVADVFILVKNKRSAESQADRRPGKDPWLAVFLSLLLPGLGHVYLRRWLLVILFPFGCIAVYSVFEAKAITFLILMFLRAFLCAHAYLVSAEYTSQGIRTIAKFVLLLILVTLIFKGLNYLLRNHMFTTGTCSGTSMEPTLKDGDKVFCYRLAYVNKRPMPGDIVSVTVPGGFSHLLGEHNIKRIVAVGGETLRLREDGLYVDGKKRVFGNLDNIETKFFQGQEKTRLELIYSMQIYGVIEQYVVPENHYFLLGDNLNKSTDSRLFGAVPKENIDGKIIKVVWPYLRMRALY